MNQYERLVEQNKQLQGELALANKVIELMASDIREFVPTMRKMTENEEQIIITEYKSQAKQELISLTK